MVLGDSKLWIEFATKVATPSQLSLWTLMFAVRGVHRWLQGHITFAHIPRVGNQLADWLANVTINQRISVDLFNLYPPLQNELLGSLGAMQHVNNCHASSNNSCILCKDIIQGLARTVRCWGCPSQAHLCCLDVKDYTCAGPWYCGTCMSRL